MKNIIVLLFLPVVFLSCFGSTENSLIDSLVVHVKGENREFSFTNKSFSQFYGLTNAFFNDGWMGWTYKEQRIFNDYKIIVDGSEISRESAETSVYPYKIIRNFQSDLTEELFIPDNIEAVFLKISGCNGNTLTLDLTGISHHSDFHKENNFFIKDISNQVPGEKLFIASNSDNFNLKRTNNLYSLKIENPPDELFIVLGIYKADYLPDAYLRDFNRLLEKKKKRIEQFLKSVEVKTNDPEFDKALLWAVASADALISKQQTKGIYAGLPWFNNYWGRDTFISLPGSTFILGNYSDAKEILLSFAKYQNTNPADKNYGRIPNRITLAETIYNTTDATPWFVIQAFNYFRYTADSLFLKAIYKNIKTAFHGAVKNYTDQNGFLTHGDADTWMDAVGGNGPWSPRGDRANDIQALWFLQLKYSDYFSRIMNDDEFGTEVSSYMEKVSSNFPGFFVDFENGSVFDRLRKDNSPDSTLRPNLFFSLNVPELIPGYRTRLKILSHAMKNLVYPYGVLSLTHNDTNFHPYHQYPPYYVKDAAYHNGIIWTWNTGPVVEALCNFNLQDTAWVLTSELTHQILHRGAVGTLSELTDALPKEIGKPVELSGTFSQAWSLAEYLRNIFNNYFGVRPDAPNKALYLVPSLPNKLKNVEFTQSVGDDRVKIQYDFNNLLNKVFVTGTEIKDSLDIGIALINKAGANYQVKVNIKQGDLLSVEIAANSRERKDILIKKNSGLTTYGFDFYTDPVENLKLYEEVRFAIPYLNPELQTIKGPSYKLLSNELIKSSSGNSKKILSAEDPVSDENYIYPKNTNFVEGILDLKKFTLKEDHVNYYFEMEFKNLHNPGWHNEYGFQLTLAAICISGNESSGKNVLLNSGYTLPDNRLFNRKIIVGGGIEIRDDRDRVIAAYIPKPADIKNPLGNLSAKTISFSLPKDLLGNITEKSKISVLIGAQDDHGGAGVGEFRSVEKEAGEWTGGGKKNSKDHNIYDFLLIN